MRFDRFTATGPDARGRAGRAVARGPTGRVVAPAWLLRDVTHVPGVLSLDGDRCRFVSTRRVVFDATPDELALAASRTRRGRFRLTVDGERIGLSVLRPAGAVPVPAELLIRASGAAGDPRSPGPAPLLPGAGGPAVDEAALVERWERLLVADGPGRRRPGAMTHARPFLFPSLRSPGRRPDRHRHGRAEVETTEAADATGVRAVSRGCGRTARGRRPSG